MLEMSLISSQKIAFVYMYSPKIVTLVYKQKMLPRMIKKYNFINLFISVLAL